MDKFGLFDIISKLTSNETALNAITKLFSPSANKPNTEKEAPPTSEPKRSTASYNKGAILSIIKRHDEISKAIDKREKEKIK